MILIAIDGACRRNGQPDCTSAGGVFIQREDTMMPTVLSCFEYNSTNQRGELLALLKALDFIHTTDDDCLVVTDSEYIFNAMTKQWYINWQNKGWVTAANDPVKNKDIWMEIAHAMSKIDSEVLFYHIKGHCIPFGKVTAENSLRADPSGQLLLSQVRQKFDDLAPTKQKVFRDAQELSKKNNGYELPYSVFKQFIIANTVVDAVATKVVEAADRER